MIIADKAVYSMMVLFKMLCLVLFKKTPNNRVPIVAMLQVDAQE